jgi:hypothetical protein
MRLCCTILLYFAALSSIQKPNRNGEKDETTPKDHPTQTITFVDNRASQTEAHAAQQQSPNWFATSAPAEWALFIAGGVGVIIALRTLRAINRQVGEMNQQGQLMFDQIKAMREQVTEMSVQTDILRQSVAVADKSTDAAMLNAQAVINAERPWLLIEYEWRKIDKLEGYVFYAVNKGETPAEIIEAHFKPEILNCIPDNLPIPPPTLNAPIFIPRRGDNLIVQTEQWPLNPAPIHPDDWATNVGKGEEVMNAEAYPYFFGVIVYRDLLRPIGDVAGLHRTRCCFVYNPFLKTIIPTGPSEYREKT